MTFWTFPPPGGREAIGPHGQHFVLVADAATRETSKLLLGLFLRRLPLQMRSQLANFPATSPAELATAADAIWSQSGSQVSAAEVTVAAAIALRPPPRRPAPTRVVTGAGWLGLARRRVGCL